MKELSEQTTGRLPYASPRVDTLQIAVEEGIAQSGIETPQRQEDEYFWN